MCRDLAPEAMRISNNGLHLLKRVLRCLRIISFRQHSASRADLDQVGAVFDVLPHLVLHRGDAVGHAFTNRVIFERQQVVVAMTSRDSQRRSADLHVRSRYLARVDRVPQIHIGIAARSPHCAPLLCRPECRTGIRHPVDCLLSRRS